MCATSIVVFKKAGYHWHDGCCLRSFFNLFVFLLKKLKISPKNRHTPPNRWLTNAYSLNSCLRWFPVGRKATFLRSKSPKDDAGIRTVFPGIRTENAVLIDVTLWNTKKEDGKPLSSLFLSQRYVFLRHKKKTKREGGRESRHKFGAVRVS